MRTGPEPDVASKRTRPSRAARTARSRRTTRLLVESLEDRKTPSTLFVGAAPGGAPLIQEVDAGGEVVRSFQAFPATYRGGVNVAVGDVNGDQVPDIIVSTAQGAGVVKVFDGATHDVLGQFSPYGRGFRGGVNVAFGQLLDGTGDIITGTATGHAVVKVFDGDTFEEVQRIVPYGRGVSGVNVVGANLDGGYLTDIVTAPARGGPPLVKSFDATTGQLVSQFLAYDASYRGGVQLASGDFDANNVPDLVTAPGGPGQPLVRVWASGPGNPMIGEFVAGGAPASPVTPRTLDPAWWGVELGGVAISGRGADHIAITPRFAFPGADRSVSYVTSEGVGVGGIEVAGQGGFRALNLASSASQVFVGYTGAKQYASAYNPTWPNWSPTAAAQLNDSDFFNDAFRGLWDIDPTTNQGRQDLQTLHDAGFNLIRLYNWGPSRGWNGTSGNAHISFLDKAQELGLKVIVPISDYFLGNDQYAWNGQNPDSTYSLGSAPQGIQDDLAEFLSSVTKNGALHPAVHSFSIGNELDLGIDNDPGSTGKLQRALWWVVNLQSQLSTLVGSSVSSPMLTIPISNADQGNGGSNLSWFQVFKHGTTSGEATPNGAVPNSTFTSDVAGLGSYAWYATWFYNSVNMFQTGTQLTDTLTQYDTGVATGSTWSNQWPGEKFEVPLMVTELGTTRFNTSQAAQFDTVANQQAQVATNVLKTSTNLMGYTIFEFNDEPNKNNYSGPVSSEVLFGTTTYNASPDQSQFRNGTLLYTLNTGATPWIGGTLANYAYPVYQLFPVQSNGVTLLSKLKTIFSQVT